MGRQSNFYMYQLFTTSKALLADRKAKKRRGGWDDMSPALVALLVLYAPVTVLKNFRTAMRPCITEK